MSAEIIHGDCLDVMRRMPDASVDAIVTDPPYFRVKGEEWDRQWRSADAFLAWLESVAHEWRRLLAPNGSLYVFTSPEMNTRVEVMLRRHFGVLNNIRWYKEAGWHQKAEKEALRSYLSPWEGVIFAEQRYGDGAAADASGYYAATTALHKRVYAPIGRVVAEKRLAAGLQRHEIDTACAPSRKPTGLCYRWEEGACLPTIEQWVALCRRCGDEREYESLRREYESLRREYESLRREYESLRRPFALTPASEWSDLWRFKPVPARPGKHPCEKPVEMLGAILRASTKPGATVLDTFSGSGATGEACSLMGRDFIGIESDAAWVERSRHRLIALQPSLLDAVA